MPTQEEIFDILCESKRIGSGDYFDYRIPDSTLTNLAEKVLEVIEDESNLLKILDKNGYTLTRIGNDMVVLVKDGKAFNQPLYDSGDRLSWRLRAALEATKPSEEGTEKLRMELFEILTKHNFPDIE